MQQLEHDLNISNPKEVTFEKTSSSKQLKIKSLIHRIKQSQKLI